MTISEDLFKGLNDRQCEAVECTEGPLLVLAGAGSGKTRILTHRIGYLIQNGVNPWNILAITFTNKAAREMRERTNRLLGSRMGEMVFVSTFHSMCVRLLRYDIDRLGYAKDFTIYDADDQRTLVRACIKSLKLDTKIYKDRAALGIISSSKNQMVDASEYTDSASDFYEKGIAKIYTEYEKQMKENNALDFDDLLLKTVELFKRFPEVLKKWQDRFIYIMVDEYQDTNNVQFELVRLLAAENRNLCVVGDDDQSIYRFRGANIENILSFEKVFSGARVVKLEQNYRSTKSILNAANEVIKNNKGRKDKRLWTENEEGELPVFDEYETAAAEADAIVRKAYEASQNGLSLKNQAVLYRTNAQSRLLEEKCVRLNIPYVIVGGVNFYQRREIKDILSYLRVIANAVDDLSCIRIINVPKRGIGQTSIDRVAAYAQKNGISFYDALLRCKDIPELKAASGKIRKFTDMIEAFRKTFSEKGSIRELIETVRDESGYADELKNEDAISAETRLENIEELINKAAGYEDEGTLSPQRAGYEIEDLLKLQEADYKAEHMSAMKAAAMKQSDMQTVPWDDDNSSTAFTAAADALNGAGVNEAENEGAENEVISGTEHDAAGDTPLARLSMFLEDISLVSDIDRADPNEEALTMMTLHAAKGLEFDTVYLCGMEEGLFPSSASINSSDPDEEIEEERRLCYVGFTRAMRRLCLSAALERMVNGETRYMKPSRFIDELSDDTAVKHFRRSHTPYGSVKSDSFAGFGGYEGRMEYGYSHGADYGGGYKNGYGYSGYGTGSTYSGYDREQAYGGNSYGSERSSGGFGRYGKAQPSGGYGYGRAYTGGSSRDHDEDAYSAYNSFDNKSVGRFGSLDPTPAGRARKKASALAGLNGTPGISKGMGGNVKHKPDYVEGDRVMHTKFGIGTVLSITDEPKDYKVSVEFDEHGTKVMYAGFAKLKKL